MLAGDFFYITSLEEANGKINAALEINANHQIFKGHFPGQPVVPGVCMLQMVKEILEAVLDKPTRLMSAENLKFLSVIDPQENNLLSAEIKYSIAEDGKIKMTATLLNEAVVCFKMSGVFVLEENE